MKRLLSMKGLAILVFLLLISMPAISGFPVSVERLSAAPSTRWYWYNPQATSNNLWSISAADINTAWAVGDWGTIVHTVDGGANWSVQDSGMTGWLKDICAIDANTAWAVGAGGRILRTMDGGKTWVRQVSNVSANLRGVDAVDANRAWAVGEGGTILRTVNGGSTWIPQNSGTAIDFGGVSAASQDVVWVQTESEVFDCLFYTTDGGTSWKRPANTKIDQVSCIATGDTNNIWAANKTGDIIYSGDGGKNWNYRSTGSSSSFMGIDASGNNLAWVVGLNGAIYKTTSAGLSWSRQDSGMDYDLHDICVLSESQAWVAGEHGVILRTMDGGNSWYSKRNGSTSWFGGISGAGDRYAWAVGYHGKILHTTDSGANWAWQNSGTELDLGDVDAVDANTAFVVGQYKNMDDRKSVILSTVDGGVTWSKKAFDGVYLTEIAAANARCAWAVGWSGTIYRTQDGGNQWNRQSSGITKGLYGLAVIDENTAWAVGAGGSILNTTDGGRTWKVQSSNTGSDLYCVEAADAKNAWAAGKGGTILHTTNGGMSWSAQTSGVDTSMFGVSALDANTAWAVGEKGRLRSTVDGGKTWNYNASMTSNDLLAVDTAANDRVWAVGDYGTILSNKAPQAPQWAKAYYFAEGYTGSGFQEYLTVGNPNSVVTTVHATYLFSDGSSSTRIYEIAPESRLTIDVNAEVGADKEVSAILSTEYQNMVAERPMYFNYGGSWAGGHDVVGAVTPSDTWYFAEGYTGRGFDEWVCVLNPGDSKASLTFNFQTQGQGEIKKEGLVVPAHSRATFKVNDLLGPDHQASLKLVSSQPVVAERPTYFNYQGMGERNWEGGHCVMGANQLAKQYYFAEGTTRPAFEEWLTLQNPHSSPITIEATYQFAPGQGEPVVKSYKVEAGSRHTVYVPDAVGTGKDVSVHLSSENAFLAERPMYFDYAYAGLYAQGGHCVIGASTPSNRWFFAEGYTGPGFNQWICLQNPADEEATVEITYFTQEKGALAVRTETIPGNTRKTLMCNEHAGAGLQLSTRIEVVSGPPIVAERPMYFSYRGWDGGHDVVGYVP